MMKQPGQAESGDDLTYYFLAADKPTLSGMQAMLLKYRQIPPEGRSQPTARHLFLFPNRALRKVDLQKQQLAAQEAEGVETQDASKRRFWKGRNFTIAGPKTWFRSFLQRLASHNDEPSSNAGSSSSPPAGPTHKS